eukprot:108895_1
MLFYVYFLHVVDYDFISEGILKILDDNRCRAVSPNIHGPYHWNTGVLSWMYFHGVIKTCNPEPLVDKRIIENLIQMHGGYGKINDHVIKRVKLVGNLPVYQTYISQYCSPIITIRTDKKAVNDKLPSIIKSVMAAIMPMEQMYLKKLSRCDID